MCATPIEDVHEACYTKVGQAYDDSESSGRSDYEAFVLAGIPSGGLFTGAEVQKPRNSRPSGAARPGEQFGPCYPRGLRHDREVRPAPAGPAGTFAEGGGGHDHDHDGESA